MPRNQLIIWTTVSGYVKQGVACFAVFWFTRYFIQSVGPAHYGLWTFLLSMLGFFELLDFGFSTAIVKYCAHFGATNDTEKRNRVISTVFTFFLLISLFGIAATALISRVFLPMWTADVNLELARSVLWILSLRVVILAMPFSIFRGVLIGNQKTYVYNLINAVMYIIYVTMASSMLSDGGGVQSVALANLLAMVFEWVAITIAALWLVRDLKILPRLVDLGSLKQIASFSTAQAIANLTSAVHLRADPLIIKAFLSLSSVATYGIGLRVASLAVQFIKQLSNTLSPAIAAQHGAGSKVAVREMLVQGSKYSLGVACVICLPMSILADRVITAWIGVGYEEAAVVMGILGLSLIAGAPTMVAANVLAMGGREKRMMVYSLMGIGCNISLSIALLFPLGVAGVAVATLLTDVIVGLGFAVGDACHGLETTRWTYVRRVAWPLLPGLALQAACLLVARWIFPLESLLSIAVLSAVAGAAFVGGWFVMDPERPPVPKKIQRLGELAVSRLAIGPGQSKSSGSPS